MSFSIAKLTLGVLRRYGVNINGFRSERRGRQRTLVVFQNKRFLFDSLNAVINVEKDKAKRKILESEHWRHTGIIQMNYLNRADILVKNYQLSVNLAKSTTETTCELAAGLLAIENQARIDADDDGGYATGSVSRVRLVLYKY